MDPAYEKYDKASNKSFADMRNSIINPYHVHDIQHNIKNGEALLEKGLHFDGEQHTYDSTDLALLLSNLESQRHNLRICFVKLKHHFHVKLDFLA